MLHTNLSPQKIAEKVSRDELDLAVLPLKDVSEIKAEVNLIAQEKLIQISHNKDKREELINKYGENDGPLIYVIVATEHPFINGSCNYHCGRYWGDRLSTID